MNNTTPIRLIFMLEEKSAEHLLKVILPKILPSDVTPLFISHQGKSDLQKSIPNKIKAWQYPNDYFIILHDQDSHNCIDLKKELRQLCSSVKCQHDPLIRIVCQELESWYFGDLDAVQKAFPRFSACRYKNKAKYRKPDDIKNPGNKLKKIIRDFNKGYAAIEVPKYMDLSKNTSVSFNHFLCGVNKFLKDQKRARRA